MRSRPLLLLALILTSIGASAQIDPRLLRAIQKNNPQAVQQALRAGTNPNATDSLGATPLMWASYKADTAVVKLLIQAGARTECRGIIRTDTSTYYGNLTGLAAGLNKLPLLRYLIEKLKLPVNEAEYNPETQKNDGWTPAEWAAANGHLEVLQYLTERGADLAVGQGNVLMLAVGRERIPIIVFLQSLGLAPQKDHPNYDQEIGYFFNLLSQVASELREKEEYLKAISIYEGLKNVYDKDFGVKDLEYSKLIANLGSLYKSQGLYSSSMPLLQEALSILDNIGKSNTIEYTNIQSLLAGVYNSLGLYQEAVLYYRKALIGTRKYAPGNTIEEIRDLNNLADALMGIEHYDEVQEILNEVIVLWQKEPNKKQNSYVSTLLRLANFNYIIGKFTTSINNIRELLALLKEINGEKTTTYAVQLGNLAELLKNIGQSKEAIAFCEEGLKIIKQSKGERNEEYAQLLGIRASLYDEGSLSKASNTYEKALQIYSGNSNLRDFNYVKLLNGLAVVRKFQKNYKQGIVLLDKARAILDSLGYSAVYLSANLNNRASLFDDLNDTQQAKKLFTQAYELNQARLIQIFEFTSQSQREAFASREFMSFTQGYSFAWRHHRQQPDLSGWACNNALFHNGLLLNATQQLNRTLNQSTDPIVQQTFALLQQTRNALNTQLSRPADKQSGLTAHYNRADSLEQKLTQQSQAFRDFRQNALINWNQIQQQLRSNEAAIEFVAFNYHNGKKWADSTLYAAFVIRPGYRQPKFVPLFEQRQLAKLLDQTLARKPDETSRDSVNALYRSTVGPIGTQTSAGHAQVSNGQKLSRLIWLPLDSLLTGTDTVYFAPAGRLNELAFPALRYPNAQRADKLTFRQLFSTRQLAQTQARQSQLPAQFTAQLFGGIDFGQAPASATVTSSLFFKGLPFSLVEVDSLQKKLAWPDVEVWRGTEATEERVKGLSGRSPNVLHFATHTFQQPALPQRVNWPNAQDALESRSPARSNPLFEVGLALTGANQAKYRQGLGSHSANEGLLYAQEVAELDLSQTYLASLAACQTARGPLVTASEGVWGLSRAFRQAGVRFLVLSQWNINDKSTSAFMSRFYDYLSRLRNIRKAFEQTQAEFRQKEPDNPYQWAFVLVE